MCIDLKTGMFEINRNWIQRISKRVACGSFKSVISLKQRFPCMSGNLSCPHMGKSPQAVTPEANQMEQDTK